MKVCIDQKDSKEVTESSVVGEPTNSIKRQVISQLEKFIRGESKLFGVPEEEVRERIKEYFLTKDEYQ